MKTLLITGANGFIGNYFINKYNSKYKIKQFSFLQDDFNILDCKRIDTVLHLSALVHRMSGASSEEYEKINVLQTIELAKKVKQAGVKQFIFMSTVKVYGEENVSSYTEESLCNPEDEYGKSKLKAEKELQNLENENFRISIIRTPVVYGANVKGNIKKIIGLVDKVPLLPLGGINNKRSIVYVGNLCHLLDEVIRQDANGIFLAKDNDDISTSELVQIIASASEKKVILFESKLFNLILKIIKPTLFKRLFGTLVVNNQLTKEKLHLENKYTLQQGIDAMIKLTDMEL